MTLKELVLDLLEYTFEQESWQPSLAMAVEGLNAQQAAWKPAPERHAIWQIVRHVTHWKRTVLAAWEGNPADYEEMRRADWQEVSGDDAAWQTDVRELHAVSRRLRELVEASDDEGLAALIWRYRGTDRQPRAVRIMRMATHDIYHAGQIRYIRALQGV